jgi:ribose 5-phosphate isomerase B
MKISLGTDHAGFRYKEKVKELLGSLGHDVKDFGTFNEEPVDYPLFIRPAAEAVARGECERGIVFGGSGNGEAMVCVVRFAGMKSQRGFHDNTMTPMSFPSASA